MAKVLPVIGEWYRKPGREIFEVVAIDIDDGTVEIQHFDGTVEEIELETWGDMMFEQAEAPEDYSGSLDIEPEDYGVDREDSGNGGWSDPLDYLDRAK